MLQRLIKILFVIQVQIGLTSYCRNAYNNGVEVILVSQ